MGSVAKRANNNNARRTNWMKLNLNFGVCEVSEKERGTFKNTAHITSKHTIETYTHSARALSELFSLIILI